MAFATKSIDAVLLRNNVALVVRAAAGSGVSTILTTVARKTFSGPIFAVIAHACGDISEEARERAMERMVPQGMRPMTSLQYRLELQHDRARTETYDATAGIVEKYGGNNEFGIIYAKTMFGAAEGGVAARPHEPEPRGRAAAQPRGSSRPPGRPLGHRAGARARSDPSRMLSRGPSLLVGVGMGVAYGLLGVRSPAPPIIALLGPMGMLAGEAAVGRLRGHPEILAWPSQGNTFHAEARRADRKTEI